MKKIIFTLIFIFFFISLNAEEWKIGCGVSSDSLIHFGVDTEIFKGGSISIEGGISWEYQVDMRIDDAKFRTLFRYTPSFFKNVSPYVSGGFQYSFVNTGYTKFWVPGIETGLGVLFPVGAKNEFYLEGGWQYASKNIHSHYQIEDIEILYQENWSEPPFYIGFGWRISFWYRD